MNQDNSAHALLKLPRKGEAPLFLEACKLLGFEIRGGGVYHENLHLANIENGRLVVSEVVAEQLSYEDLPPLNGQRKIELNRIYLQLNAERVAIHEAGHAVAAVQERVDFCYVRIGLQHELQICSAWNRALNNFREERYRARKAQFVAAAGAAAKMLILGDFDNQLADDQRELNQWEVMLRDANGVDLSDNLDVFGEHVKKVADDFLRRYS